MAENISVMRAIQGRRINPAVMRAARKTGAADTQSELIKILERAVPYTHPFYNRRTGDVLFRINRGQLCAVHVINCQACGDTKKAIFWEECERCSGNGCCVCKDGQVKVFRECSECKLETVRSAAGTRN